MTDDGTQEQSHGHYIVSDMSNVSLKPYMQKNVGIPQLKFNVVTEQHIFGSFEELKNHVLSLRYPTQCRCKEECYGWTGTIFEERYKTFKVGKPEEYTKFGRWRDGEGETDVLGVAIFDIDNANSGKITEQDVSDNLAALGLDLSYFTYTSYSDTQNQRKFRLVMDISRLITRDENRQLAVFFDQHVFDGQADTSIYDPSDFLYAPPHHTTITSNVGGSLDTDVILEIVAGDPVMNARAIELRVDSNKSTYVATPAVYASLRRQANTYTVSVGVSKHNPRYYNPDWDNDTKQSHWERMRSKMGKVWLKSKGTLTYGEMEIIATEIDACDSFYFNRNHGNGRLREIIKWVMDQAVSPSSPTPNEILASRLADLRSNSLKNFKPTI